jgi:hypothetical protein
MFQVVFILFAELIISLLYSDLFNSVITLDSILQYCLKYFIRLKLSFTIIGSFYIHCYPSRFKMHRRDRTQTKEKKVADITWKKVSEGVEV